MKFSEFLLHMQKREGIKSPQTLIFDWSPKEIAIIEKRLKLVFRNLSGKRIESASIKAQSNQSKGSAIEKYVCEELVKHNNGILDFMKAGKSGYPDGKFIKSKSNVPYCVEIKATSNWKDTDSNRRVLLSSTRKLRTLHESINYGKIKHLILTCIYNSKNSQIKMFRIDFLDTKTEINVRFEASTSHKKLNSAKHYNILMS